MAAGVLEIQVAEVNVILESSLLIDYGQLQYSNQY